MTAPDGRAHRDVGADERRDKQRAARDRGSAPVRLVLAGALMIMAAIAASMLLGAGSGGAAGAWGPPGYVEHGAHTGDVDTRDAAQPW